ncbi:MAG TPA: cation:proton antiporter [Fimbriimonadaceae bacterium]|nr:cation:proton antiporter [Fimbriimonadaceae bacterium]
MIGISTATPLIVKLSIPAGIAAACKNDGMLAAVASGEGAGLLVDLGTVLIAALIGGYVARKLKMPVLVGYLAAGVVVGPYTPGFIADTEAVQSIANLGIVLLMFAVGVQFSLNELKAVRWTALVGGTIQIVGTIAIGWGLALAFGLGHYEGLFLGCALALSSTAVIVRVLEERAELGSSHGGILLGIAVVQDLSLIVMVAMLPALAQLSTDGAGAMSSVGIALVKAAAFLVLTVLLAIYAIPALLSRVVRTGSPELFLLTIVALCMSAAVVAEEAGLGHALGAFLAGIVVSESPYSHEVFSQVKPLRDVFASLFFVSIGMLLNPLFLMKQWPIITAVVFAIVFGKALVATLAVHWTGWHLRTSLIAGIGLAQIGEFSFVLAMEGARREVISPELSSIIMSSALLTILIWPFYFEQARPIYGLLCRIPVFHRMVTQAERPDEAGNGEAAAHAEVIILGGGRVGRYVSDAMRALEISHVVVDFDSAAIARLRENKVPVLFGDASAIDVIEKSNPERAKLAIVALPEAALTHMAVKALRHLAPDLRIAARVRRGSDIPWMRQAGADAVIHGEFESGVEMIRQTLDHLGFADEAVDQYIEEVRQHRYRSAD